MNLIERAKNMLLDPKKEWEVVKGESTTLGTIFISYVLPLVIVSALGTLLSGVVFSSALGVTYAIKSTIIALVISSLSYFLATFVIDLLAPSFGSDKDINKSAQLVAYANTPSYVAGLLSFVPIVGALILLAAAVYGIYLLYLGLTPIKKTPEDKKIVYLVVAFVAMFGIGFVLSLATAPLLLLF